jgi:hypothetical protein
LLRRVSGHRRIQRHGYDQRRSVHDLGATAAVHGPLDLSASRRAEENVRPQAVDRHRDQDGRFCPDCFVYQCDPCGPRADSLHQQQKIGAPDR